MAIELKQVEKILKALANRRRLSILAYLHKVGAANVGQIAVEIGLSFRATSRHIGLLYSAGLLDKEQKSLEVYYRLANPRPMVFVEHILSAI